MGGFEAACWTGATRGLRLRARRLATLRRVGETLPHNLGLDAGTPTGSGQMRRERIRVVLPVGQAAADHGSLIGLSIEAGGNGTALEIVEARVIEGPPFPVRLPHRAPPGIHGAWLPSDVATAN